MEFGLHLGTRGAAIDPDNLTVLARHAEAMGFHHLGFSDHIVIATAIDSRYPYNETGVWPASDSGVCLEQLTTLAFVAAATEKIRLLTSVMVLPYRPAILAAKMLATVDVLSKGRVTVGVGVGWMAEEMALLGSPPYSARGRASDEYIEAFRTLWTAGAPALAGDHVAFDGLLFEPKPVQSPHPPIWIGGEGAAARRRAGQLGDGWYPVGRNPKAYLDTPELFATGVDEVREHAAAAGRDAATLDIAMFVPWLNLSEVGEGREGGRLRFTGGPETVVEDIQAYQEAGLQHLVVGFESDDLQQSLDWIEEFDKDIMVFVD
jgi:probable F420-dependent oxidoreductase